MSRSLNLTAFCLLSSFGLGVLAQSPPEDAQLCGDLLSAVRVIPSPRQQEWQRLEFIGFAHFGPNTFTDREWGTGEEEPSVFNPSALDCKQWVKVFKEAGMKEVILTAKHHDGFCLWPSRFTEHSVKNSPWRGGQGDVVRELATACQEAGLKLGVYLSPADLNAIKRGIYGSTPVKPGVIPTPLPDWKPKLPTQLEGQWDEYNTYFLNQLFELLTDYGPISEVWFDGANPKPGTGQKYAYADWYRLIRKLQPGAVIFGKGPDVRWCGNEAGRGRASEWSVIPLPVRADQYDWPDMTAEDLGSISKLRGAVNLHWYPSEVDVSIRPGWFYHAKEDGKVKSLEKLSQIYYSSVGNNGVLLLNVPPDRRGLIAEPDVSRLREFGAWIHKSFSDNLALGAKVQASHIRDRDPKFDGSTTLDNKPETFWWPDDWQQSAELTYQLPQARRFNVAMLQEHLRSGQRIESFAIDGWLDGQWKEVARGTTVGYKRLVHCTPIQTDRVRVRILNARVCPTLSTFGLFWDPLWDSQNRRLSSGEATAGPSE